MTCFNFTLFSFLFFLQSFADTECSGKINCEYKVRDLVDIAQPCPLELSSYHEASFICVSGKYIDYICSPERNWVKVCSKALQIPHEEYIALPDWHI